MVPQFGAIVRGMIGNLLSHYRLLEPLGAGGMGEVYRARDERLERDVALKVLPKGSLADEAARARFRNEALALSRLSHPRIGTVHEFGSHEGVDFLVMEYVPGRTLGSRIREGRFGEREAIGLAIQIAEALEEAHECGVVHRDLKPDNIVLTPKGWLKVLDFGLAKLLLAGGDDAQTTALSAPGSLSGTLPYMSPEQLLGRSVDARTDLWALGAVLYEMVTGRRPFTARLMTALSDEIVHKAPDPPRSLAPEVSPALERVILRCLEKDPEQRFADAAAVAADLRAIASGAAVTAAPRETERAGRGHIESLAVLPLENLSGDPDQEFFADGMTEELIASLAQIGALRVISRTSVMRYKGARKPLPEIARELNVDAVVEGSVRRAGDRVRITAQLLEAATDRHLWAKSYERDLRDILALQGEVAQAIAQEVQVKLTAPEEAKLRRARVVNPDAYEAYLRGRHVWNRRSEDDLRRGIELFNRAVELDPLYPLAHVGIADSYNLLGYHEVLAPREAFPRAKAAARRALELDDSLGEARISLAYGLHYYDWDWEGAEREYLKGIERNEGYAQGHLWYANLLVSTGRFEEAERQMRRALELDPLSLINNLSLCWIHFYSRQFDQAVEECRKTLEMDRTFMVGYWWLGLNLALGGRTDEALRALEQAAALSGNAPMILAGLALAQARAGQGETARAAAATLEGLASRRYVSPYDVAFVRAALGEGDAAMAGLEKAYEERSHLMTHLRADPRLDPLRQDPRFADLLRRMKFPAPRA
jgi:eukaryotic-like serine/threonine-protein kinase